MSTTAATETTLGADAMTQADARDESALHADESKLSRQALWERKLLDFSLRNNLLNTRLGKRAVQLVTFGIAGMEDRLHTGESYTLCSWPAERKRIEPDGGIYDSATQAAPLQAAATETLAGNGLLTYLTATELKSALTNLYRGARTALEENGACSLFIAIGMLRWYVSDRSEQPRYAPLLLMPVDIVRRGTVYVIRKRDEETIINTTLCEFLRQQYHLAVPSFATLPLDGNGVDVPLVLDAVRKAIGPEQRWQVLEETMLGLFSFGKFVMWNDIHSRAAEMLSNPIVASLVERRLKIAPAPSAIDAFTFDRECPPATVATPISADASQLQAIIDSGQGKSFILYGPPGTGKSQTITNIIANALYQGKRVLFVAEKMAALSVVHKRLSAIGLSPFCIELHSNKATKSHFLQQLAQAMEVTHGQSSEDFERRSQELFALRRQLNATAEAMHHTDASCGLSAYECIDRCLRIRQAHPQAEALRLTATPTCRIIGMPSGYSAPACDIDRLHTEQLSEVVATLRQLDALFATIGHPHGHPLAGFAPRDDHRETLSQTEATLRRVASSGARMDAPSIVDEWNSVNARWWLSRWIGKRSFVAKCRAIDNTLSASNITTFIESISALSHDADLTSILEHRREWAEWCQWAACRRQLIQDGWGIAVDYIEQGHSGSETATAIELGACEEWGHRIIDSSDALRQFQPLVFEDAIARYRQLTAHFQAITQTELYCRLAARVPSLEAEAASGSEVSTLKRNIANGGRGTSIRHLIEQTSHLLPRLCPCMLMSPISVAQYIDLSSQPFDLVVFDEASQMPTAEAIGAIARGKSLIVVGDPRQMPPTSFFSTTQVDEEEADIDDLDSVLDDCQALSMPSHQLNCHYRSRHESLIAFSNKEYYDGRLLTFPSPDDQQSRVSLVHVDGVYDKGGRRSNRAEAAAVVAEALRRLADDELSRRSIGIVSFSVAQQNLIEDLLIEQLAARPDLEARAYGGEEPIFVKNLENVQGDERDVILFSVGYGPDAEGKVSMNFGPLNNQGGERRLNVAVSRARHEMVVFSCLLPEQVDLRRSQAAGVVGLHKFLAYAQHGNAAAEASESAPAAGTPCAVAEAIAAHLASKGYTTTLGVGRSELKVDVAVHHPSHPDIYLLGLLIDTPARSLNSIARDRAITQPAVLKGLGWHLANVWSADYMRHPDRVHKAVEQAIADALADTPRPDDDVREAPLQLAPPEIIAAKPAARQTPRPASAATAGKGSTAKTKAAQATAAPVPANQLEESIVADTVVQIVEQQVAIPQDDLMRAAARALGFAHRGSRIDAALQKAIDRLVDGGHIDKEGDTLIAKG